MIKPKITEPEHPDNQQLMEFERSGGTVVQEY